MIERPTSRSAASPVVGLLLVLPALSVCTTVVEYEDVIDETGGVVTFGASDSGPVDAGPAAPADGHADVGPSPTADGIVVDADADGDELADVGEADTVVPLHDVDGASPAPADGGPAGTDASDTLETSDGVDGGGAGVDATSNLPDVPAPPGPCGADYVRLVDGALSLGGATWRPKLLDYRVEVRRADDGSYFVAPQHTSCSDNLCCLGPAACADALALDLITIKGLGFQAVRVSELGLDRAAGGPVLHCVEWSPPTGFGACEPLLALDGPSGLEVAVAVIDSLLAAASDAGLRVILPVGRGDLTGADAASDHAALLSSLATPFATEPALLAWELVSEPDVGGPMVIGGAAEHAALIQSWYDAVRAVDGAHLISIGLAGSASLGSWDPTRSPVDLITFHAFPGGGFGDVAEANFRAEYGWMVSLGAPALVAATGLATGDAGLEAAQVEVASSALELARSCGALGQGWWTFRDRLSEDVAAPPEQFGLVRVDGSQKPAAAVFGPFDLDATSGEACPQVGVPETEGAAAVLTGRALDPTTGKPIPWARVTGSSCVDPNELVHTFTRSDGRFTLVAGHGIMQVVVAAAAYAGKDDLWPACQNVDLGDMLLQPTPTITLPSPPACE